MTPESSTAVSTLVKHFLNFCLWFTNYLTERRVCTGESRGMEHICCKLPSINREALARFVLDPKTLQQRPHQPPVISKSPQASSPHGLPCYLCRFVFFLVFFFSSSRWTTSIELLIQQKSQKHHHWDVIMALWWIDLWAKTVGVGSTFWLDPDCRTNGDRRWKDYLSKLQTCWPYRVNCPLC